NLEGVVAQEELDEQEVRHRHHEVLPGALLVRDDVGGRLRVGLVRPDDVAQQRRPRELLRPLEHPRVLRSEWLVPEQYLPRPLLERRVVARHHRIPLRPPVLPAARPEVSMVR
ncbi:unnamed protein product, partial [Musa banksii]